MPDSTLALLTAKTPGAAALLYGAVSPYTPGLDRKVSMTAAGATLLEAANAAAQLTALGAATLGANTYTGVQLITDGTAAAPALAFANDTNTGIYSSGADLLSIATAGAQRMQVGVVGGVGTCTLYTASGNSIFTSSGGSAQLGSTSVNSYLGPYWHVNNSTGNFDSTGYSLRLGGASGAILSHESAGCLKLGADHATTATAQTLKAHDVTTGTGASMTIAGGKGSVAGGAVILATSATNGAPVTRMTVAADGKIGMGTTSPAYALDVQDNVNSITRINVRNSLVGGSGFSIFNMGNDTGESQAAFFLLGSTNPLYAGASSFNMIQVANAPLALGTNNVVRMTISGSGDIAMAGATTITSSSATALTVGQNGATNPALQVDASTGSSATGIKITSAAAGGGVTITATSSAASESLTLSSKGSANTKIDTSGAGYLTKSGVANISWAGADVRFDTVVSATASTVRYNFTGAADTSLTASTEAPSTYFNIGQTRQHATGALTLQRDFRITGSTHSFVGASTLTDAAAFSVDGPCIAGTNATITNSHGIYVPTRALTGTITNAYGLSVAAPSGATNNYAAQFDGKIIMTNLPTSSAGLPTGALWNNSGVLNVA